MLKILVADDEALARTRLTRLLAPLSDVEVVGECDSGEEVLAVLAEEPVDVLLLDINMPGLSGLETKALLGEDHPYVIFATAYPEHAIEAFDLGAVDYVLKPIEPDRLRKALDRARKLLAPALAETNGVEVQRLAVPTRDVVRLIDPAVVTHALFDGTLVTLYLEGGESLLTDLSLSELERRLPPGRFERVHRRAIVGFAHLAELEPVDSGGYVGRTTTGEPIPISRQAARRLRRRLGLT